MEICLSLPFSLVCKTSIEVKFCQLSYPCLFLHNYVLCPRLADEERRKSVKFFRICILRAHMRMFHIHSSMQRMIWSMWNSKFLNLRWIIKRKVHTRLKCRLKRKTAKHTQRVKGELATALVGGEEKISTKQGQTAAVLEVIAEVKCIIARRKVVERQELIKSKQN